jgi:hypothetical protein
VDVVLFSGDAYIDHPSFGAAVIGRLLESMGLQVAIVPQPIGEEIIVISKRWVSPFVFCITAVAWIPW